MSAPVLFDGRDDEYPVCPGCGQAWKVSDRAHKPHATPVDPPSGDRRTYLVTGCRSVLTKHEDIGADRVLMSWACDGHTMTVAAPVYELQVCLGDPGGEPCRGGQPLQGGRWGAVHQCRCCNSRGTHYVRRDGQNPPTCGAQKETTPPSNERVVDGQLRGACLNDDGSPR